MGSVYVEAYTRSQPENGFLPGLAAQPGHRVHVIGQHDWRPAIIQIHTLCIDMDTTMPGFYRRLLHTAAGSSLVVLACCSSSGTLTAPDSPQISTSTATTSTVTTAADRINQLLLQAANAVSPQAEQFALQASQLALDNNDVDTASAILGGLGDSASWPPSLRATAGLQRAQLALAQHEAPTALIVLNGSPFDQPANLTPEVREAMMRLRTDAFLMLGQHLAAAREYTRMAELLTPQQQAENTDRIWQILASAPPGSLQAQNNLVDSYELRGWLELANVVNNTRNNIEEQVSAVTAWQTRWNRHSASARLPQALSFAAELLDNQPQRVALLIPLSEAAGKAVAEGFMAAYYDALSQNQQVPDIRVYDTSGVTDVLALYNQAVESGVELIIGPLNKDSVRQLQALPALAVPTLALNYGDEGLINPENLYQYGLAPEDEIRQSVQLAWQAGHRVATVMTPAGEEYRRIRETFESEWQALGGHVVANAAFTGSSYSDVIRQMMDVDDSEARAAQLRSVVPRSNLVFTPRRRQDVDVMFLLANPSEGRQIGPAMAFHFAGDVAVYAMPAIHDGAHSASTANRDLNGIVFIDAPWLLSAQDPLRSAVADTFNSGAGPVERLRAMGVDSYRLLGRLAQLANFPGISIAGASGTLTMRPDGSIKRELLAARFVEANIELMQPAAEGAAAQR